VGGEIPPPLLLNGVSMKKLIMCDIDSTLHPFESTISEIIYDLYGQSVAYEKTRSYNLENITMLSPDQIREAMEMANNPIYIQSMHPYPGAVEALSYYMDNEYEIRYITSRDPSVHKDMYEWLCTNGFIRDRKVNNLFCVGSNDPSHNKESEKIRIAHLMADNHPCLFIDDNPVVLELCYFSSFLIPASLIHPWNEYIIEKYGICSAPNWGKLTKELNTIYGLPNRNNQRKLTTNN
jgi:5'(3')-deoxyribonucleotidase